MPKLLYPRQKQCRVLSVNDWLKEHGIDMNKEKQDANTPGKSADQSSHSKPR